MLDCRASRSSPIPCTFPFLAPAIFHVSLPLYFGDCVEEAYFPSRHYPTVMSFKLQIRHPGSDVTSLEPKTFLSGQIAIDMSGFLQLNPFDSGNATFLTLPLHMLHMILLQGRRYITHDFQQLLT